MVVVVLLFPLSVSTPVYTVYLSPSSHPFVRRHFGHKLDQKQIRREQSHLMIVNRSNFLFLFFAEVMVATPLMFPFVTQPRMIKYFNVDASNAVLSKLCCSPGCAPQRRL